MRWPRESAAECDIQSEARWSIALCLTGGQLNAIPWTSTLFVLSLDDLRLA
jgi:hypothetical protein